MVVIQLTKKQSIIPTIINIEIEAGDVLGGLYKLQYRIIKTNQIIKTN